MRLLVDSHAIVWAVENPSLLAANAAVALRDIENDLLVSAASIWELSIKYGLGRLSLSLPYREWMMHALVSLTAEQLPVTIDYAAAQAKLPFYHRDPFDRLLVAQAQTERVAIVSADAIFDRYGITRIW